MPRLEENNSLPENPASAAATSQLIKEEAAKLRPKTKVINRRPFFSCFNCCLTLIVIFLVLVVWLLSLAARSGIWSVPILTPWLYREPAPIHWVKVTNTANQNLNNKLAEGLAKNKIVISEEELTALLQQSVTKLNSQQDKLNLQTAQIAFMPTGGELFVKLQKPFSVYLTLNFMPRVSGTQLTLVTQNFKVGQLALPVWLGQTLLDKLFDPNVIKSQLAQMPLELSKIELFSGYAQIDFSLKSLNNLPPTNAK